MPTFSESELLATAQRLLAAMGAKPAHADVVASELVDANLAGHDSHGVIRLPQYHADVKAGKLRVDVEPAVSSNGVSMATVDGAGAWGQVVATRAIDEAIERARVTGMAIVTVRRCQHVGRVGAYARKAALAGLVAQIWCNGHGAARVAPWGGTEARLATNPIAIGLPTGAVPVVVDITTSVVAEGKVRVARNKGVPVPPDWILDKNGRPTTNPADLYEGGTILPLGGPVGHKGFALGLVVDLLGGVLSGAGCGLMPGVGVGNGMCVIAFDPARFGPMDEFHHRAKQYLDYVRSSRHKEGVAEILLPGEPEEQTADARRSSGVVIDEGTWSQLQRLANELGVELP